MEIQSILGYSIEKLADLESDDQNVKMGRLREFLEELGDINFQDSMGWSALHLFTMRGWLEGIKLVLNNPDARLDLQTRKGQTALHCALDHSVESVKLVCEDSRMTLSILHMKDIDGATALQLAKNRKNVAAFISKTKLKLSTKRKERSRKKSAPKTSESSDSDDAGGRRNFEEENEFETKDFNQPGPSRTGEYFEETEQKPKRLKTEAKTEDDYFSLFEEFVSMERIIKDFTTKIKKNETELQEQIDNNKALKKQVQQEHKAALERLRAEQEKEVENLEKTLEKEIQAKTEESLKPLQEELGSWQRQRDDIKARLKTSLQADEPTDLPKCPDCELSFDDKRIFSCLEGHSICSDCRPQRENCLECSEDQRQSGYPARNTFMEAQMRKLMAGR